MKELSRVNTVPSQFLEKANEAIPIAVQVPSLFLKFIGPPLSPYKIELILQYSTIFHQFSFLINRYFTYETSATAENTKVIAFSDFFILEFSLAFRCAHDRRYGFT
jgi:hypothetical protein